MQNYVSKNYPNLRKYGTLIVKPILKSQTKNYLREAAKVRLDDTEKHDNFFTYHWHESQYVAGAYLTNNSSRDLGTITEIVGLSAPDILNTESTFNRKIRSLYDIDMFITECSEQPLGRAYNESIDGVSLIALVFQNFQN